MNKKGCKTCKSYSYKSGTRKIETEGREPVFDEKGELIYYNPNEATHNEGGVPAVVMSGKMFKYKVGDEDDLSVEEIKYLEKLGFKLQY